MTQMDVKEPASSRPNSVQSVDRAIDILEAFSLRDQNLSLGEIAGKVGLNKATAHRIVTTLRDRGLISQNPTTKQYCLGSEVLVLAAVRARQNNLTEISIPVVRQVRDEINETTSLAIRVNNARLNVYQLESLQAVRRGAYSGEPSPLYAGASKQLLAAMSDSEIERYLGETELRKFTPFTITTRDALWEEIRKIRSAGYSESWQERFIGAASIAVPVRDSMAQVVATLYSSFPAERFDEELKERSLKALLSGAEHISAELGYRG